MRICFRQFFVYNIYSTCQNLIACALLLLPYSNSHPNIALFVMKLEQRHIHSGPVSLDPRLHSSCASLFSSSPSVAPLSPPHSYSTATLSPPPRSHYELNSASTILNVLAPSAERYPSQVKPQSQLDMGLVCWDGFSLIFSYPFALLLLFIPGPSSLPTSSKFLRSSPWAQSKLANRSLNQKARHHV